ncbi:DMT family transporter [Roseovarius sp. C7]|uniref:DMT family transporter n=1 Tax=Roseovarius sp. C7 TaxID=3398643 RepID=UPI0039F670C1
MDTNNTRAALLITLAMVCFTSNDAFVKLLGQYVTWQQALLLRSLAALVFLMLLSPVLGGLATPARLWRLAGRRRVRLRVAFEALGLSLWVLALVNMPLSGAIAINQLLPVFLMLGGVLAYGERPGPHRSLAALVSVLGVVMVVRPGGETLQVHALLAVVATACMAGRDVVTRGIAREMSPVHVALLSTVTIIGIAGLLVWWSGEWRPIGLSALGAAAGSGGALCLAFVLVIRGSQMGEVSFVAPFRYAALVWGMVLAWVVFGERADLWALGGAAVIIASGVYLMLRERRAVIRDAAAGTTLAQGASGGAMPPGPKLR